jgi:hypothetical protein
MDETVFYYGPRTSSYGLLPPCVWHWHRHGGLTNSLHEKKNSDCDISAMVHYCPKVHAAIHAQQEMATLRGTSSPAVLKIDADKKKMDFTVAEAC